MNIRYIIQILCVLSFIDVNAQGIEAVPDNARLSYKDEIIMSCSSVQLMKGTASNMTMNLDFHHLGYVPTAIQFNLYLPEGVELAKNGDGVFVYNVSNRIKNHELDIHRVADGSYQFFCYSSTNEPIVGEEGELLTITLQAGTEISGTLKGIKNVVMADVWGRAHAVRNAPLDFIIEDEDAVKTFSQPSTTPIWNTLDGRVLATPPSQRGIYIKDGKKLLAK